MRFLVDENLSATLAQVLSEAGHDAVHVRDVGAQGDTDQQILQRAQSGERIVVSADTDFGALLARSRAPGPSVILVRNWSL